VAVVVVKQRLATLSNAAGKHSYISAGRTMFFGYAKHIPAKWL
jgi:hypothetical protein